MPARPSMATLIADVRRLCGDSGGTASGSDDDLQSWLDEEATYLHRQAIAFDPVAIGGGTIGWFTAFIEGQGYFEGGSAGVPGTIYDARGGTVGGWYLDPHGIISFTNDQHGTALYFSGYSYDIYAGAAATLEGWAGRVALQFDFTTDGQQFMRSQQCKALLSLAEKYRARQLPKIGRLERWDEAGDG